MAIHADRRSWKPSRYLLIQVLSTLAVLACVDARVAIQDALNEADVQILSPHFEAKPAEKVVSPPTAWRTPPGDRFA